MFIANAIFISLLAFFLPMDDPSPAPAASPASLHSHASGSDEDSGENHEDHGLVVFEDFPDADRLIRSDIRPYMHQIIEKHGHEEWKYCVLTSEIHQHLGIYSLVGVKMGLRAREFFDVGVDALQVTSYAGARPPISCLNDGIQVSTGATLGHGTIHIAGDPDTRPEAEFTRNGRTVRIRLKPEYLQRIKADVSRGIEEHGNQTEAYFHYIRQLAIKYWLELDRKEIFELQVSD
jgi:formylmethanofuran dehydrogenase subunit E